jgi:hypothetical protein
LASSRPPRHGGDDFGLQLALHLGARERPAAQQHHGNVGRAVELLAQCGEPYSIACGQPITRERLTSRGKGQWGSLSRCGWEHLPGEEVTCICDFVGGSRSGLHLSGFAWAEVSGTGKGD